MLFLIRMAIVAAAGAAAWGLARQRRLSRQEGEEEPKLVYLRDEDAVVDGRIQTEQKPVQAIVKACYRRMDPLTLNGGNEAVFTLMDGTDVKLRFSGEGGLHLRPGEQGMLTWEEDRRILFEKQNGDVIGGMFYMPAQEAGTDE